MHDPKERHLQNRIIQHMKTSLGRGLLFRKEDNLSMEVYNDADCVGSVVDRRSTIGYCMFLPDFFLTRFLSEIW